MTKREAIKVVENEGFAWRVEDVVVGDNFTFIYCLWNENKYRMNYSNELQKVISIDCLN